MTEGPTRIRGEDLFRHMVEAARDYAIFAADPEGVVVAWNEGAERVFGYSEAEIVGEDCRILFTPEDMAAGEPERELAKAAAEGRAEDERWHMRRDGSRFWASGVVNAIKDEAGQLRGFVKIARDETGRKLYEEALRESEQRLALAQQAGSIGTFDWDVRTDAVSWTEELEALFGLPPGGFGGTFEHWRERVHPEDLPACEAMIRDTLAARGEDWQAEYRMFRADTGAMRWIDARSRIFYDEAGAPARMIGVNVDVTERKLFEEALRASARTSALVADVESALARARPLARTLQGCVEIVVAHLDVAFARIWLLDEREEVLQLVASAGLYTHLDGAHSRVRVGELKIGRIARDRQPHLTNSVADDPAIGDREWARREAMVSFAGYPLIAGERLLGVVAMFARRPLPEATLSTLAFVAGRIAVGIERRLAEEERERLLAGERAARADAEAANRIKDEFLATVSHELRTPLNAVLGWIRMLRAGGLDAELSARALETIERNADAQARLIDDLLDVARIISGKVHLEMRPLDPASFVQAAVEAHLPAAEVKGILVETSAGAGVDYVHGDPERLQQVVWNLLSNAIKFTPKDGRVGVHVERVGPRVEIRVSDTGKGISAEFLPHVFDRFRQADATTTRRHRGLGLGLAIVRHLVELHGGAVRAESGGEGRGTTFTVAIPARLIPEPAAPEEPTAREDEGDREPGDTVRLDGVRVLVVDDELDSREMLRVALGRVGAEVETAGSAAEALDAFARRTPDVLVSDIGMPDVDGYELVRRVRDLAEERGGRVPAVALTAYARAEDRGRAVAAGYDAHVPKPVSAADLADLIARFVRG